ncbi:MAG: hypothetical protein ACYS26_05515 [Planctomycetota bacterium]
MSAPLLWVARTPGGELAALVAAEELPDGARGREGSRGRWQLLPDLDRASSSDLRARRTTLGDLLSPLPASSGVAPDDLLAHLVTLPDPLSGRAQPAREVRVLAFEEELPELEEQIEGPGGCRFRLTRVEWSGAELPASLLIAGPTAAGGPWIRNLGPESAPLRELVLLLGEARALGLEPPSTSPLALWLASDSGGRGLSGKELRREREVYAALITEALCGASRAEHKSGARLELADHPLGMQLRFSHWDKQGSATCPALELRASKLEARVAGQLFALVRSPLAPYWVLSEAAGALGDLRGARRWFNEHLLRCLPRGGGEV